MKILLDIGHPAHVHVLKHFAREMTGRGHTVLCSCRRKEFIVRLLETEGLDYVVLGDKYKDLVGKAWGLVKFDWKLWRLARRFRPDFCLSLGSPYLAHAAWLLGKPHVSVEDTYNREQVRLYAPFTRLILTGDYPHPGCGRHELRLPVYNELAYLAPGRFRADASVRGELGVGEGESYALVRFVAWQASHDRGHRGMSEANKRFAVQEFSRLGKVFISSEGPLPEDLESYRLPTAPERIHDVIAGASLVFGESSTMAEEAAMLGVPSVFINETSTHYTLHLERDYGLMSNLGESESAQRRAIETGVELLSRDTRAEWQEKRLRMLSEHIDLTSLLVFLAEGWPESAQRLRSDPDLLRSFPFLSAED